MKQLLLCIGASVALSVPSMGQLVLSPAALQASASFNPTTEIPVAIERSNLANAASLNAVKPADGSHILTYRLLGFPRYLAHAENGNVNTTFHYDPTSRRLYLARIADQRDASNNDLGDIVLLLSSSNNGTSWDTTVTLNTPGQNYIYPSIGTYTPQGQATSRIVTAAGIAIGTTRISNLPTGVWFESGPGTAFADVLTPPGSQASNPERTQIGAATSVRTFAIDTDVYAIAGSSLQDVPARPTDPANTLRLGGYGFFMYDFLGGDYVAVDGVPEAWRKSANIDPTATGTYNSALLLDTDDDGTLYAAHTTPAAGTPSDQIGQRLPRVSVSEDLGATWSTFASRALPTSALQQYGTSRGWSGTPRLWFPYQRDGFIVYGSDRFSYFFHVISVIDNNVEALDLVEAAHDNGVWTIRQVAEMNDFPQELFIVDEERTEASNKLELRTLTADTRRFQGVAGWEINVAKTADGQNLVISWIDSRANTPFIRLSPGVTVQQELEAGGTIDRQIDSLPVADLFMAYRPVGGTTWTRSNITNDDNTEYGSVIPRIVPSLTEIPVIMHITLPLANWNTQHPWYPKVQRTNPALYSRVSYLGFTSIAVGNLLQSSVNESTEARGASIERIAPNPSITGSEISWAQVNPGHVTIQVVNVLGAVVKTAVNGMQEAGQHFVNLDVHDMAAGTYSIVLTVNGASISQPLVVVR